MWSIVAIGAGLKVDTVLTHVFCFLCAHVHAGKSLLWVAALGAVVLYIYAVIAYAGYQMYFDDPGNSSHCKTLFECVVSVFRLGLLNGALVTVSEAWWIDGRKGTKQIRICFVTFFCN